MTWFIQWGMMSIKTWLEKKQYEKIDNRVKHLVKARLAELVDVDGNVVSYRRGISQTYRGNQYNTYSEAVAAINEKYNGVAEWGTLLTGNIIDVRAAFTVPAGLEVIKTSDDEDIDREMAFTKEFMDFNGLNDDTPFEFAKEEEIEGKLCVQLFFDNQHVWRSNGKEITGMVKIRFLPWTSTEYRVITMNDYMDYLQIVYTDQDSGKPVIIEKPKFTYRRFGGRIDSPNQPAPKVWKCLTQIDFLDHALRDWREIDRLFASPTPYFKTENEQEAKKLIAALDKMNWKVKKLLAGWADFKFVGIDIKGIESLAKEITMLAKMISGTTGVPVHFLGLPDLMSNRSVADNLMELVWASTVKERETWNSAYSEILVKAINLFNSQLSGEKELKNDVLRLEVQHVTSEQWMHLEKVFMPLLLSGKLSLEYVLSQIPNLVVEEELQRQEMQETKEIDKVKDELDKVKLEKDLNQNNDQEDSNG